MNLPLNAPRAEILPPAQRIHPFDQASIDKLLALVKRQMAKSPVEVVNVQTPQGRSKRDKDL